MVSAVHSDHHVKVAAHVSALLETFVGRDYIIGARVGVVPRYRPIVGGKFQRMGYAGLVRVFDRLSNVCADDRPN